MTAFDPQRLRPYQPNDLAAVLAFAGACNARSGGCGYLHPGDIVHLMSNALRGRDLDCHVHLYEDDDARLLALALLYPVRDAAYDLLVRPDAHGGDLERGLIGWCERATESLLRSAGGASAAIGCDVMDCDAPRRDLLLARGYAPADRPATLYTTRSLDDPLPDSLLPEGFSMRSVVGEHEVDAVCAVHDGSRSHPSGPTTSISR